MILTASIILKTSSGAFLKKQFNISALSVEAGTNKLLKFASFQGNIEVMQTSITTTINDKLALMIISSKGISGLELCSIVADYAPENSCFHSFGDKPNTSKNYFSVNIRK